MPATPTLNEATASASVERGQGLHAAYGARVRGTLAAMCAGGVLGPGPLAPRNFDLRSVDAYGLRAMASVSTRLLLPLQPRLPEIREICGYDLRVERFDDTVSLYMNWGAVIELADREGLAAVAHPTAGLTASFNRIWPAALATVQKERFCGLGHGIDRANAERLGCYLARLRHQTLVLTPGLAHQLGRTAAFEALFEALDSEGANVRGSSDGMGTYRYSAQNRGVLIPLSRLRAATASEWDVEPGIDDELEHLPSLDEVLSQRRAPSRPTQKPAIQALISDCQRAFDVVERMPQHLPPAYGVGGHLGRRDLVPRDRGLWRAWRYWYAFAERECRQLGA